MYFEAQKKYLNAYFTSMQIDTYLPFMNCTANETTADLVS